MKIDRLIAILLYLMSRDKVTARELATYFSVTLRTIYRDMEALGMAGVPIASTSGQDGGYGLMESFTLNKAFFKEEELLSLFSALKGINSVINDKAIESVLLKLKALSPRTVSARAAKTDLPRAAFVPIPWGMPSARVALLEAVRRAVERRRVITFTYTKSDGNAAVRRVEPLTLVLQADVWYLYAWDLEKKDYRFFRLSRVSALDAEHGTLFVRKPGRRPFPWEGGWEGKPPTRIRLAFHTRAAQRARDLFSWETPVERADGTLEYCLQYPYDDWVECQIFSFGPDVEVLEPEWLRLRIRRLALQTADLYISVGKSSSRS